MAMFLQHPCDREHTLILQELSKNSEVRCFICHLCINGPTFCCWDCNIFLHKLCAELPLKTEHHPAHPEHPSLSLETEWVSTCTIPVCTECDKPDIKVWVYRCDDCHFRLDARFVSLTLYHLEEDEEREKIQHFDDDHPLTPFNSNMPVHAQCRACGEKISGPIYGCRACNFYIHEWCAQIPKGISQHPFHPQHHLSLYTEADAYCSVCHTRPEVGTHGFYVYKCEECKFSLDIQCASLEPSENQQEECGAIKGFSHQHQLAPFFVKMENPQIRCEACDQKIFGEVYGCPDCRFFLHKSCPPAQHKGGPCKAKHQPHEHDLTYFEGDGLSKCNYCGEKCPADSYRCVECNFIVHYNCIWILPLSITHDCHFHPLVLRDRFVPYQDDEQYCHVCEKTRRPDRGVYCCEKCEFAAHIGCVIPWVKIEEPRLAELKKLDGEISCLEAEVEETETSFAAVQMKLQALKLKLKELRVKRDDLAFGAEEEGPNMEKPTA